MKLGLFLNFDKTANWGAFIEKLLTYGMSRPENFDFLKPTVLVVVNRVKYDQRDNIKNKFNQAEEDMPNIADGVDEYHPVFNSFKTDLLKKLASKKKRIGDDRNKAQNRSVGSLMDMDPESGAPESNNTFGLAESAI